MSIRHTNSPDVEAHVVETGTITAAMMAAGTLPGSGSTGQVYATTGPAGTVAWSALITNVAASPVGGGYVTPLMFDHTGTTGGLYAWIGSNYVKIGLATS